MTGTQYVMIRSDLAAVRSQLLCLSSRRQTCSYQKRGNNFNICQPRQEKLKLDTLKCYKVMVVEYYTALKMNGPCSTHISMKGFQKHSSDQ